MIRPSDTVLAYAAAAMLLAILSLSGALWLERTLHAATKTTLGAAERERDAALSNEAATGTRWQHAHAELQAQLQACQRQWHDVQAGDAAALKAAVAARRQAEAALQAWERRWHARTQQCGAALLDAERACPDLGDY